MTTDYGQHLDRVLAKANFGKPVEVQQDDDGNWRTIFGAVVKATTVGANGLGVGPVVLIRRVPQTLQIFGSPPGRDHVRTRLRFGDSDRLYLTAIADNGQWVWQMHAVAPGCRLAKQHQLFVGVWRD